MGWALATALPNLWSLSFLGEVVKVEMTSDPRFDPAQLWILKDEIVQELEMFRAPVDEAYVKDLFSEYPADLIDGALLELAKEDKISSSHYDDGMVVLVR